jgi:TonB family protein
LFSQRVLVALDTGQGVIYASASGWDRIYLLWTFRNFRSLPQNVLSLRQQQLIGSLYRQASSGHSNELYEAVIAGTLVAGTLVVGTVESFKPSSLPAVPSSANATKMAARISGKKLAWAPGLGRKLFHARFTFNRMTMQAATAALVVTIAILAWHQLGAQPLKGSESTAMIAKDSAAKQFEPAIVEPAPNAVVAMPSALPVGSGTQATVTAHTPASVAPIATPMARISNKPKLNESTASSHHPVADPPAGYEASANEPRMQISGRPRKLVYPVLPETHARGKVSLQAVVGYDGAVNRVRVLTGDRALAAAAVEAVRQWRYEPFSGAVPPLERETNITISFISNEVVAVSFPASTPLSR